MVGTAIERARSNGFEHVRGQECDTQDLPYDNDLFDVFVANHMLYHVPDPDLAISELARTLRPNGILVAATIDYGHMQEMNDAIAEVFGARVEALYEVFGVDTGEAELGEQFTSVVWHAYDNELVVDDPAAAVAYDLSFPPGESAYKANKQNLQQPSNANSSKGSFVSRLEPASLSVLDIASHNDRLNSVIGTCR